jgi:hypothetical protein
LDDSDRFDINAIAEDVPLEPAQPGVPNRMQLLMRTLLKERFALVVPSNNRRPIETMDTGDRQSP